LPLRRPKGCSTVSYCFQKRFCLSRHPWLTL
jgi:hypothetical protein